MDQEIEKKSYLTEVQKTLIQTNEKVHTANILLDNMKLSADDLTGSGNFLTEPEILCKFNIIIIIDIDPICDDKETQVRENGNILYCDHPLLQEKVLKSKTINTRYNNCNYDANRLELVENFFTTNIEGNQTLSPGELQTAKTFRKSEGIAVKLYNITIVISKRKNKTLNSTKMNNPMVRTNILKNSSKINSRIYSATKDKSKIILRAEKFLTKSAKEDERENYFKKNTITKKKSSIASENKGTLKSEISTISSYRVEKSGHFEPVQRVLEFHNIIQKPKLNETTSSHLRNYTTETETGNKKIKMNNIFDDYDSTNHMAINKYKFIFSDVDAKINRKNHNNSQYSKPYNSYHKESEEIKNLDMIPSVRDFSEKRIKNFHEKNTVGVTKKISNLSNILI